MEYEEVQLELGERAPLGSTGCGERAYSSTGIGTYAGMMLPTALGTAG